MNIHILTAKYKKEFQIDIQNVAQLLDYLENNEKEILVYLKKIKLIIYTLNKEEQKILVTAKTFLYKELFIIESIQGEAAIALFVAIVIAVVDIIIIQTGLYKDLGDWWYVLAPHRIMNESPPNTDPAAIATRDQSYFFNGNVNIKEQGGSLPLVFGECLFSGIIISANVKNSPINVGSEITLDNSIPEIDLLDINNPSVVTEATWYRIK